MNLATRSALRGLLYGTPLVLLIALVALLGFQGLQEGRDPRDIGSPLVDVAAPEFTLPPTLDSRPGFTTADLRGELSLVNVFASWCAPCQVEHPLLMRLAEAEGLPIYGIAYKNERAAVRRYLAEAGNPFAAIGHDPQGRVAIEWGAYGLPETYLVDAEGRIRFRHAGPLLPEDVNNKLLPLIETLRAPS